MRRPWVRSPSGPLSRTLFEVNLQTLIQSKKPILVEGAMVERLSRMEGVALDSALIHAPLIYSPVQALQLGQVYRSYLNVGRKYNLPILTLTPTWRANFRNIAESQWKSQSLNEDCVHFLKEIRTEYGKYASSIYVGGMMGPSGDCYRPNEALTEKEAFNFHISQARALHNAGADFLLASTLPAVSEAIGLARAMSSTLAHYAISFVVRPDGTVLDGTPLHQAILAIDQKTESNPPIFYAINCVHPEMFRKALVKENHQTVKGRLLGFQANTSARNPEELDCLLERETIEPITFGNLMQKLRGDVGIQILGGCCGTDDRHIDALAKHLA